MYSSKKQSTDHQHAAKLYTGKQYTGVAIGLHWLIAIVIISMLAVGKYMTQLDENDPVRYALTQWHKSFGISVLLLSVFRILWRLAHKSPPLPTAMPAWEKFVAGLTHYLFYLLIIGIPLSGWVMVSASPLNLPTVLFKLIPWPHLPPITTLPNKADIAELSHFAHTMASNLLGVLLVLHVIAALRHQFIIKDGLMSRMSPMAPNGQFVTGFGKVVSVLLVGVTAFGVYAAMQKQSIALAITGDAQVTFQVPLMGDDLSGAFPDSQVVLTLDKNNPGASSLAATVPTGNVQTTDASVTDSLPATDWFDSSQYPEATFESTKIERGNNDNELMITGSLTLKNISREISFPLTIDDTTTTATGTFVINRLDFDVGKSEQPDDGTVGFNVLINFSFATE